MCVESFDETLTFERFFESVKRGDVLGVPSCIEWPARTRPAGALHGSTPHNSYKCTRLDTLTKFYWFVYER